MPTIMRRCYILIILIATAPVALYADETVDMHLASANPCNPCAMKVKQNPCNPCSMKMKHNPCNPCSMKMKHNPCNPCSMKMKHNPCNPCSMKIKNNPCNPCGMKNPCAGTSVKAADITRPHKSKSYRVSARNHDQLLRQGEALWNDSSLSSNGLTCQSCHMQGANFNKSYMNNYPHQVEMVSAQAGISAPVTAEQMVQFCMVVPMAAKPLAWNSRELAALTVYVEETSQPAFAMASKANPCSMKMAGNPCSPKNPCGMKHNPCGMKNPCNPCGMKNNPCSMKSASNPCGMKNPCAKEH